MTQFLIFNGIPLPHPDSYSYSRSSVEAATSGETEAGTRQSDIVRTGVTTIAVSFSVKTDWVRKFKEFNDSNRINVRYFDTDALSMRQAEMKMTGYSVSLVQDTEKGGFWNVSFNLEQY